MYNDFDERAETENGELEGLAPFLFVVALLAVAFVLDCLL